MALEEWKLRLTSAKVEVEVEVEAELGNNKLWNPPLSLQKPMGILYNPHLGHLFKVKQFLS